MIAHPGTLGRFKENRLFKTLVLANKYIPFYVFHTFETIDNQKYYSKPCFETVIKKTNTIKNIKDSLASNLSTRKIVIGPKTYFFVKGVMFNEMGMPLIVFAMPREKFLDPNIKKFSEIRYSKEVNPVNYKDFVLFYSTSFFTDPSLTTLNRRFQKEILGDCFLKGIEVRVITSQEIEKNTFADLFEIPKANSVSQLEEYMTSVLPNYLYTEEEDTFVFEDLKVSKIREELDIEEEALLFDSNTEEEDLPLNSETEESEESENLSEETLALLRELEMEAATWNSAHTVYPVTIQEAVDSSIELEEVPTLSVRPNYNFLQTAIGEQLITGSQRRDRRPIELIDDEI